MALGSTVGGLPFTWCWFGNRRYDILDRRALCGVSGRGVWGSGVSQRTPLKSGTVALLSFDFHRFFAAVETTFRAYTMEQNRCTAVRAGCQGRSYGFVVRSSLVTTSRRDFVFRMCHFSLCDVICFRPFQGSVSGRPVRQTGLCFRSPLPGPRGQSVHRIPIR